MRTLIIFFVLLNVSALAFGASIQEKLKRARVQEKVEGETGGEFLYNKSTESTVKADIVVRLKRQPNGENIAELKSTMYSLSEDVTGVNYIGQNIMQVTTGKIFDPAEQQAFREAVMKHLIVLDVEFISKDKYKSTEPYKYKPLESKYKPAKR